MGNFFNKVTKQYLTSVHTPDFINDTNYIKVDIPLENVPVKYWKPKIDNSGIEEMTVNEKKPIDLIVSKAIKSSEIKTKTYQLTMVSNGEKVLIDQIEAAETKTELDNIIDNRT